MDRRDFLRYAGTSAALLLLPLPVGCGGPLAAEPALVGGQAGSLGFFDEAGRPIELDRRGHRLILRSASGARLASVGGVGPGAGQLNFPSGVAALGGLLYVVETGNDRVQIFDGQGRSVGLFGGWGAGPGQLDRPAAIVADSRGRLLVADPLNHRVAIFDRQGTWLGALPMPPGTDDAAHPERLPRPRALAVAAAGEIHVVDAGRAVVDVYGADDRYLRSYGAAAEMQSPAAIAFDGAGRAWIGGPTSTTLHLFDAAGTYLGPREARVGGRRVAPVQLATSPAGDLLVAPLA